MREEKNYKDKLCEINCSHRALSRDDVMCCQPQGTDTAPILDPSFSQGWSQPLGAVPSLGLVHAVPPQLMAEGCAQVLFFHIPFSDLNNSLNDQKSYF